MPAFCVRALKDPSDYMYCISSKEFVAKVILYKCEVIVMKSPEFARCAPSEFGKNGFRGDETESHVC